MVLSVFRLVFKDIRYILIAIMVAFIVLSATFLLPNQVALIQIFSSDFVDFGVKMSFLFSLYGSLFTNFSLFSGLYLVSISLLFGIDIALLTYFVKQRKSFSGGTKIHIANIGGLISAIFGIGCAACGSAILTAVFGIVGAGSLLVFLPLHGLEFGIVGVSLLLFSIYYLAKKIDAPLVCAIN